MTRIEAHSHTTRWRRTPAVSAFSNDRPSPATSATPATVDRPLNRFSKSQQPGAPTPIGIARFEPA
jgi:hypothetical protein